MSARTLIVGRSKVIVCNFTGSAAMLPAGQRKPLDVLRVLARSPQVSCFDLSELRWLSSACDSLRRDGFVTYDASLGYPWCQYLITDKGRKALAGQQQQEGSSHDGR